MCLCVLVRESRKDRERNINTHNRKIERKRDELDGREQEILKGCADISEIYLGTALLLYRVVAVVKFILLYVLDVGAILLFAAAAFMWS